MPRPALAPAPLPASCDVLVVGSGYTGLNAALVTARAGRDTLVLDAEAAGWGCSTRNGGQVSTSIKPDYARLTARHGTAQAQAIVAEGQRSLDWLGDFVASEGIDCDYRVTGRFHAAHTAREFERMARALATTPHEASGDAWLVPRAEQARELDSPRYFGGTVYPRHAAISPARYHAGLLQRVGAAGARVHAHCPVLALESQGNRWQVRTARGSLRAREVVVATNGYTTSLTPWMQRRVIPIGSYMIATEALPGDTLRQLIPNGRVVSDTRKVVYYYRPSPDGRRILFGGRVSAGETDPLRSAPHLHAELLRLFPALAGTRMSHSWMGFVAYTFDTLAHIGRRQGLHYAMGYCGSGVGMASYLGMRLGHQVLGDAQGDCALRRTRFPTRPLYSGKPWFLGAAVRYYRWRDRR